MSRFGIRKKLKSLVNGSSNSDYRTFSVTFQLPDGTDQVVEAEEGYTLLMASQVLPSPISTGRRTGGTCPDGACGLCRVEIVDTTGLNSMIEYEQKVLDDSTAGTEHEGRAREPMPEPGPNTRLGCHTRIIGDGGVVKVAALVDYDVVVGEVQGE